MMIVLENHIGSIRISKTFLYSLIVHTVTSCFGVAGLNDFSLAETIRSALFPDSLRQGVQLHVKNNELVIELHIITGMGANIKAISESIREKVYYAVEKTTGIKPAAVNVYIDGISA